MENIPQQVFIKDLEQAYLNQEFARLTLSKPRVKKSDLRSVIVSPVALKMGMMLNIVYRYNTRDVTKNFLLEEGLVLLEKLLREEFLNADMYLKNENVKMLQHTSGKAKLIRSKVESPVAVSLDHNRTKNRLVSAAGSIWMKELGITNAKGEVRREMNDKYVQINRYIELLAPELELLKKDSELNIADMGSGKGYLTFALYDYLSNIMNLEVNVTGVEFRKDLVEVCNKIAGQTAFDKLRFVKGSIEESEIGSPDILIALHACNTATDDAIYRGITGKTALIVCAPCCHKQIRKQMNPSSVLSPLLKHGIVMERQAELITDSLRALLLEAFGYKTRVFEFVTSGHTPKNVMIVGRRVRELNKPDEAVLGQVAQIKELYGIKVHYLEKLLGLQV